MKDKFREVVNKPFHIILMLFFLALILTILWLNL